MRPVPEIQGDIEGISEDARFEAWTELYSGGDEGESECQKILQGIDPIKKVHFARFLAHVPEERAVRCLCRLLEDDNAVVQQAARKAFGRNRYDDRYKVLAPLVLSPVPHVQSFTIEMLVLAWYPGLAALLLNLLPKASDSLLPTILFAFRQMPDIGVLPHLIPLLRHADRKIRIGSLLVVGALAEAGEARAREVLLSALSDREEEVRERIVWVLGRSQRKGNLRLFLTLSVEDPSPLVRAQAVVQLASFPNRKVMVHLVRLLSTEKDRLTRLRAESVLTGMPKRVLVSGLKRFFSRLQPGTYARGLVLFAEQLKGDPDGFDFLARGFAETADPKLRGLAMEALGALGDPRAVPLLEQELYDNPLLTYTAMRAILKIVGRDPSLPYVRYLEDPRLKPLIKQLPLKTLVSQPLDLDLHEKVETLLLSFLKSDNLNLRYLAAQGLSRSRKERVLLAMAEGILKETDPTALSIMRSFVLSFVNRDPLCLPQLMGRHLNDATGLGFLVNLIRDLEISPRDLPFIITSVVQEPLDLLHRGFQETILEVCVVLVSRGRVLLEEMVALLPVPVQGEFLRKLAEGCRKDRSLVFPLPSVERLQRLVGEGGEDVIELLALFPEERSVIFLVGILSRSGFAAYHERAKQALRRVLC